MQHPEGSGKEKHDKKQANESQKKSTNHPIKMQSVPFNQSFIVGFASPTKLWLLTAVILWNNLYLDRFHIFGLNFFL
jgi:hypothetical protein